MTLKEILKQIDELQSKINSFGKLDNETLKRIHYKFRWDWNYHSNAMEGNSLTKEETRSVMVNNITVEGKPMRDVIEIRGHDSVISDILKIGTGELRLAEKRIKDIHKAIMYEDNPEQQKKIGVWKTEENHLINYKGEKYVFTPPTDVPEAMHKLLNELNARVDAIVTNKKDKVHPVFLAFYFHIAYVSIHPFYDGNGRTARILMNLILISFGYPPVIIKINDKNIYNQYLADIQAYGGDPDLFMEFMGKLLIKSQELVLTAIEGGNIDEPDDLDKRLVLLEKELESIDPENKIEWHFNSPEVFLKMFDMWISNLLKITIPVIQKFNKFFAEPRHYITTGNVTERFVDTQAGDVIHNFRRNFQGNSNQFREHDFKFNFRTTFNTFIKGGLNTFNCAYGFTIKFEPTKYSIIIDKFAEDNAIKQESFLPSGRLLHKPLTKKEMEEIAKKLGETILESIDYNTKKSGIR